MKIAISATGRDLNALVDQRFGRTRYFIIYDTDTDKFDVVDNVVNLNAVQGAGIQSAQNVLNTGAAAVITGNLGPKAFRVLNCGNVAPYLCGGVVVSEAITKFKNNELQKLDNANVESHW